MNIDFPSLHEEVKPEPRWRPLKVILAVIGCLLGVVVVVTIPVGASAWRMYEEATAGRAALVSAVAAAQTSDFDKALTDVGLAQAHLAAANRFGVVLAPFEVLPYVGTDIRGGRTLIASSLKTANALLRVGNLGQELLAILSRSGVLDAAAPTVAGGVDAFFRLPPDGRRAALATLERVPTDFSLSIDEIDEALKGFNALPNDAALASINAGLAPVIVKLQTLRDELASAAALAKLLPALSGYPDAKKYLILFQNSTELRPTGGFIGTLGEVTINAAQAESLKAMDVYAIDGAGGERLTTVPPAPVAKYLSVNKWYLRDANWSPDFPTAAANIVDIYSKESAGASGAMPHFDGVLAVDPMVASELLRLVGAVTIGNSTFTADNVTDEIEYQVEKGFDAKGLPVAQRKDILVALMGEVFKRVLALPSDRWPAVVDVMTRALYEKHMLIASFDPTVAAFVRSRNWDGVLRGSSDDYLMVVDANLAALKTDAAIKREIVYNVRPDFNGLTATVTLRYANRGHFDWKTTRYRTYTRIFVPAGSTLLSSSGAMLNDKILDPKRAPGQIDTVDELGHRSFGAFLSVEPGETRELSFVYRLPDSIVAAAASHYSLLVQKQPGTEATPLTLGLDFGKKVTSAVPPEEKKFWGDSVYTQITDLRIDREFAVGL